MPQCGKAPRTLVLVPSSEQCFQEPGQIISVMMNVIGLQRLGRHMYGAHAQGMRGGQVARIIFEHGGLFWADAILAKHHLKGLEFRLWAIGRVFDTIDGIKDTVQPTCRQHPFGIGSGSVGIDNLAPGQGAYMAGQILIRLQVLQINFMHFDQIGAGIDPMFAHQPGQGGAIGGPIVAPQVIGAGLVDPQFAHQKMGHFLFDLIKQPRRWRVERIVEVEDPFADVGKIGFGHGAKLQARDSRCNTPGLIPGTVWLLCAGDAEEAIAMKELKPIQKDAYSLILEAIDTGLYRPGDRLVESELADRFGVSRTPIREALQRLETQSLLARDGRSLIVASLDHNQLSELYAVRAELEGLAARLAARHATSEEISVLKDMVAEDRKLLDDPAALSRANRRFHKQIHLASHNRYLVQQLDLVHRTMALMATTSLAAEGRGEDAMSEHAAIVDAIEKRDEQRADDALKRHISKAFVTRLKLDSNALGRLG